MKMLRSILNVLLFFSFFQSFAQQDGIIDSTFGLNGAAYADFLGGTNGLSMKLDSQRNLIACGDYFGATNYDFAAIKFDSLGQIDNSFGVNGKFIFDFGLDDYANSIVIQNDNKIILGGYSSTWDGFNINSIFNQISLIRLHSNGVIDSTFGINGKFELDFNPVDFSAIALSLQSDGKIIVVGKYYNGSSLQILTIRITQNGNLDMSFGIAGLSKVQIDSLLKDDEATSCVVQQDNKILIGAITFDQAFSGRIFGMVRLTADGNLDSSFGINGIVKTDIPNQGNDIPLAIVVQNDGKILQAGTCKNSKIMALSRFNTNGSLDSTFANNGIDTLNISLGKDIIQGVIVQPDNRIIIVGQTSSNACILRLNQFGFIDTTFNNAGINYFGNSTGEMFTSVLLMNESKIIAGGFAQDSLGIFQIAAVAFNSILYSGIDKIESNDLELKIYPNPSDKFLNFTNLESNSIISIFDLTGQLLILTKLNDTQELDISNLSIGIYFIHVESSDLTQTVKFIKQ